MTLLRQRIIFWLIMIIFCGVVFHAPFIVGVGSLIPGVELGIKAWKEVLLVVLGVLVAVEINKQKRWRALWNDWVIRLSVVFMTLHVALLLWMWQGVEPAVAGLMIDLRFVAFFVAVYVMVRLHPEWRRPLIAGGTIAAVVSMVFALLQVTILPHDILTLIGYSRDTIVPYLTVDQNYDFIRITGTLRGPNPLGIYAAIVMASSVAVLLLRRHALAKMHRYLPWAVGALGMVAAIALWFTYSRSAKIAAACAVGVIVVSVYAKYINKWLWAAGVVALLVLFGGLYTARDTSFVSNVILHEDPTEGGAVNSNDEHLLSLLDGAERMAQQPLGAGIGSTGSPSLLSENGLIIENHYLYIAHEAGWIGFAAFLALFGVVMTRLWRQRRDWLAIAVFSSGVGIAIASLFLPVWADDTVAIVWWALAGLALGSATMQKEKEKNEQPIK